MNRTYFKHCIISIIAILGFIQFTSGQERSHLCYDKVKETLNEEKDRLLPTLLQNKYDMKYYFINLNVENYTTAISGDVTMTVLATASLLDTFSFHLHELYIIDSIKVGGQNKMFIAQGHERIIPDLNYSYGELFSVQIWYHGEIPAIPGWGEGLSVGKYGNSDTTYIAWTHSEPNNTYRWLPIKMSLTDKIDSIDMHYTTTLPNVVASNGLLQNTVYLPENKVRYEWKTNYPIAYYLITLDIGRYKDFKYSVPISSQDSVICKYYLFNNTDIINSWLPYLDVSNEMVTLYSQKFVPYPFHAEKYGGVMVPTDGGMEHQTLTEFGTNYYQGVEYLAMHELAHHWFGDMVTCASWEDVWLNEGFGTYCEYIMQELRFGYDNAQDYLANHIRNYAFYYANETVHVPLNQIDDESRIFSGTSYYKGAMLVHNLRFIFNDDDLFFGAIRKYLNQYAYGSATTNDFKEVMEEVSELDLNKFFEQWFYGRGYPVFEISWYQKQDTLSLIVVQHGSHPSIPFFQTPFEIQIKNENSIETTYRLEQNLSTQYYDIVLNDDAIITDIIFDKQMKLFATAILTHIQGINNNNNNLKCSIYPNPALNSTVIKIENEPYYKNVEIQSLSGATIMQVSSFSDMINIDTSSLPTGVYVVKVNAGKKYFVTKLARQ